MKKITIQLDGNVINTNLKYESVSAFYLPTKARATRVVILEKMKIYIINYLTTHTALGDGRRVF